MRARLATRCTTGSSRNGAARGDGGELGGELAEHEVLGPPLDEAERGGVPERGAAAVAEQHLVAVGEREQVGEAGADATDDRRTPRWRWLVPR